MVLRLGNYLQKQPDGISTKETVLNETSEDEVPEREGEGAVEMASKEVRKALTALNQNNHRGGNKQPEQPRRDEPEPPRRVRPRQSEPPRRVKPRQPELHLGDHQMTRHSVA